MIKFNRNAQRYRISIVFFIIKKLALSLSVNDAQFITKRFVFISSVKFLIMSFEIDYLSYHI